MQFTSRPLGGVHLDRHGTQGLAADVGMGAGVEAPSAIPRYLDRM